MLENPAIEILFPHEKFLHGNILQRNPLPKPKNPPENVYTLPNNHYYM